MDFPGRSLAVAVASRGFRAALAFPLVREALQQSFPFFSFAAFGKTTLFEFAFLNQVLKFGWHIQVVGHCEFLPHRTANALMSLYLKPSTAFSAAWPRTPER